MKRIALVTSGGDAPGMNAVIRAVTRLAHARGIGVIGFERGWDGLIEDKNRVLTPRSVGGIIQQGGTILYTSRSQRFRAKEGRQAAAKALERNKIEGLVVVGGNGSFSGAHEFSRQTDVLIVGVPTTIDNDVYGTDETIGFDTAVNTALAEIDKIRDTAISHERIFIAEVMGRTRGFLATTIGLTAGAELILVPEVETDEKRIIKRLVENARKGKKSGIIVAAEGIGDTRRLAAGMEKQTGSEVRLSVLGYAQRGGSPTARSRLLANLFADKAVNLLIEQKGNAVVGLQNGKVVSTSLEVSCKTEKKLDLGLLKLADALAI